MLTDDRDRLHEDLAGAGLEGAARTLKNKPPDIPAGRLSTRCTRQQNKVKVGLDRCPVAPFGDITDTGSRTARTRRSITERLLSWGLPPFQRSSRRSVARSLVPRSPSVVGVAPRPWGLPDHRRVRTFENDRSASPRVGSPSEYDRVGCRCPLGQRRLPWSFSPLQRIQMREPTCPGFASSRFRCGYRVSHPLAALHLPRPSDRLGPVTLMGLSPSKPYPPAERLRLSARVALLPLASQMSSNTVVPHPSPDGPGFRALLPAGIREQENGG